MRSVSYSPSFFNHFFFYLLKIKFWDLDLSASVCHLIGYQYAVPLEHFHLDGRRVLVCWLISSFLVSLLAHLRRCLPFPPFERAFVSPTKLVNTRSIIGLAKL